MEERRRQAQESVLKTIGPIKMAADNITAMFLTGEGHDHRGRVLADMLPRRLAPALCVRNEGALLSAKDFQH